MKFLKNNMTIITAILIGVVAFLLGLPITYAFIIGALIYLIPSMMYTGGLKKAKNLLQEGQFDQVVEKVNKTMKIPLLSRKYKHFMLVIKADAYQRRGKFSESLEAMEDIEVDALTDMLQANFYSMRATNLIHVKEYEKAEADIQEAKKADGRVFLDFMNYYIQLMSGNELSILDMIEDLSEEYMELRDYDFENMEEKDILYRLRSIFLDGNTYVHVLKCYYLGKICEKLCKAENVVAIYNPIRNYQGKCYFKSYAGRYVKNNRVRVVKKEEELQSHISE
ncbi:hypothetical protein [Vallitalea okinawensis]|uniref:hypothetical protein n=1 Tax=Vallitalea okinawensis TaxID=2078660 RepID=UPI000CFD86D5|nr:hypothetical protein [Vallitalea okinawensis]